MPHLKLIEALLEKYNGNHKKVLDHLAAVLKVALDEHREVIEDAIYTVKKLGDENGKSRNF